VRAIIQRAKNANVSVEGSSVGSITDGLVVFLGVTHDDTTKDIERLVHKIIHLRIFSDENGKMNHSLLDVGGSILSISQFTLYADTRKGRRPSYQKAASPDLAEALYQQFNAALEDSGIKVATGVFGAMMDVHFTNVGPVTITLDTDE